MTTIKQFLGKKIFENRFIHIDRWSIVHFVGFFLLGIYFPNKLGLIIIGTILFEVFENIMSKRTPFFKESAKDTLSDIGFNILGYLLGQQYLLRFGGFN